MINFVNRYELFIFDLDDTLVKTEIYHYNAWLKTLKYYISNEYHIDHQHFFSIFHSTNADSIVNYITNELNLENFNEICKLKQKYYYELIENNKNSLNLIEGCQELLEEIIIQKKHFVIVSNNLKNNIEFFQDLFPILKKSTKIYYREMMKNKKPHPECYINVTNDFKGKKSVGFEDSITGIHAITQVPEIKAYFINNTSYYYYNFIMENYLVNQIVNYNKLIDP